MPKRKEYDAGKALSSIVGNNQKSNPVTEKRNEPSSQKPDLVHRSYYVRPEHHMAIGVYAAKKGLDKSRVVREALDAYLGEFMKNEGL